MKVQVKLSGLEGAWGRKDMKVRVEKSVGENGSNGSEKGTAENWERFLSKDITCRWMCKIVKE